MACFLTFHFCPARTSTLHGQEDTLNVGNSFWRRVIPKYCDRDEHRKALFQLHVIIFQEGGRESVWGNKEGTWTYQSLMSVCETNSPKTFEVDKQSLRNTWSFSTIYPCITKAIKRRIWTLKSPTYHIDEVKMPSLSIYSKFYWA